MALVSPGVQVSIIDESNYISSATNSVPYFLIATAQNKASGSGIGVAAGTTAANANKAYLITSQRDLTATFGNPFFYKTTTGTPINGYELNEYGLLAAYSALGITNRAYVQRCDIDLTELTASLVRPTGEPNNGAYWLDTANTLWGIFEWNSTTAAFTNKVPGVITDTTDLTGDVPSTSYGSIGDYAVVATDTTNPIYYKNGAATSAQTSASALYNLYNTWVPVGSNDWKLSWPTVIGQNAVVSDLTAGRAIAATSIKFGSGTVLSIYEQGTWTPVVTSSIGSITSYTSSGNYTRVGNVVTISGFITITNNGTGLGNGNVSGLPYTVGGQGASGCSRSAAAGGHMVDIQVLSGGTSFTMWKYDNTYPFLTGSELAFSFSYLV
jgi:hypothetical protein